MADPAVPDDTIFALSSGAPPAAVALIRISGPHAGPALAALAGRMPSPRRASLATLRDPANGSLLDRALLLWFPGPASATGEDLAELHLHGGRAVVRAVEGVLAAQPGLRRAAPGEFTRRAFAHGRIDLAEAEGLADLLSAETEWQRTSALAMASGALSRLVEQWHITILALSARLEARLDFADEDDVAEADQDDEAERAALAELAATLRIQLAQPRAERLREGIRVVLAGPPNVGKSTLLNALAARDAAIVSDIAGTTRDLIETSVALGGVPFLFVDTAGLRETGADAIEAIGIARAEAAIAAADIVLWLGPEGQGPAHPRLWEIAARADAVSRETKHAARHTLSAVTGSGMTGLVNDLIATAADLLPPPGEAALNGRQAGTLHRAAEALEAGADEPDPLLRAEALRQARAALDALTGASDTEAMLDALFGRFCIGK